MENEFILACKDGNINEAQTLLQNNPTIDISAGNENAFVWACVLGRLEVAQWLLQVRPTIDISALNEFAFREACADGHLEVAQWLLQIKPTINIFAQKDYAFRWTCNNNNKLNVAQWLQLLMPFKYVIKTNRDPYIRPNNVAATLALISVLKFKGYTQYLNADLIFAIATH